MDLRLLVLINNSKEVYLQDDQATPDAIKPSHEDINRALHAIAAHLHRYTSELTSIEDTTNAIVKTHRLVFSVAESHRSDTAFQRVEDGFNQAASHLTAAKAFELELEKKIENILALVGAQMADSLRFRADNAISSSVVFN